VWLGLFVAASAASSLLTWMTFMPDSYPGVLWQSRNFTDALSGLALAELTMALTGISPLWLRVPVWLLWSAAAIFGRESLGYRAGYVISLAVLLLGLWHDRKRMGILALVFAVILSHMNRSGEWLNIPVSVSLGHGFQAGTMAVMSTALAMVLTF